MCSRQLFKEQKKKILECGQGINQSLERQSLHGTMCSGFCVCEFIFQMKVLDIERLCLLSKVTRMKTEKRQGFRQGSVSSSLYS